MLLQIVNVSYTIIYETLNGCSFLFNSLSFPFSVVNLEINSRLSMKCMS